MNQRSIGIGVKKNQKPKNQISPTVAAEDSHRSLSERQAPGLTSLKLRSIGRAYEDVDMGLLISSPKRP